jgi:hypothetical protein
MGSGRRVPEFPEITGGESLDVLRGGQKVLEERIGLLRMLKHELADRPFYCLAPVAAEFRSSRGISAGSYVGELMDRITAEHVGGPANRSDIALMRPVSALHDIEQHESPDGLTN